MPKMNLSESYADGQKSYGPGDGIEVPAETAKKIRAYEKEFLDDSEASEEQEPSAS